MICILGGQKEREIWTESARCTRSERITSHCTEARPIRICNKKGRETRRVKCRSAVNSIRGRCFTPLPFYFYRCIGLNGLLREFDFTWRVQLWMDVPFCINVSFEIARKLPIYASGKYMDHLTNGKLNEECFDLFLKWLMNLIYIRY